VLIFVVLLCTTKKQEVKNGEHIKRKVPPKIERERKKNRKEHNKNNIDWRKIIMKHTAVRQRLIIFFFGDLGILILMRLLGSRWGVDREFVAGNLNNLMQILEFH
jgi:hypothetical protein